MDYFPDDIDQYVADSKRLEAVMEFSQNRETQTLMLECMVAATKFLKKAEENNCTRTEACAALGGMMGQLVAEYAAGNLDGVG